MEALLALVIGLQTAAGTYLMLRLRSFSVIIGTALLTYAVNLFLFASGRLAINLPPIYSKYAEGYTDPLPQALVLTAIVISFGMTAVVVLIALGGYLEADSDRIDLAGNPGEIDTDEFPVPETEGEAPNSDRAEGDPS
ncbi:Na+/H+ antiporter subunit C [Tropicimonas sp. IMCC34043]|uniref:Na+/H+ antiporter subunit C n=1 Tax=Tropicimonas sp. IMCC34043 TaxID=2248760 RepID=UPI000E27DA24|nr:Na+/H+ antiporter subunit C [Tropicimonas sp. IMCC34043]